MLDFVLVTARQLLKLLHVELVDTLLLALLPGQLHVQHSWGSKRFSHPTVVTTLSPAVSPQALYGIRIRTRQGIYGQI